MTTLISFFKASFVFSAIMLSSLSVNAQTAVFAKEQATIVKEQIGDYTASGARIISDYNEGLAITKTGERYGLVNKQGYELSVAQYDEIHGFVNGFAAVRIQNQWTFINKQGQRIAPARFDWVSSFHNGFAAVQIAGKWGFINEQGLMVTDLKYDRVAYFEGGVAPVKKGEQWLYVNERGEEMTIAEELQLLQASL